MLVDTGQPKELDGTIAPAVNDEGGAIAAPINKEAMMLFA